MSNVIRLCDRERRVRTVTPPTQFGVDEFESLFNSWCSINLSFEKLQDYLDQLRPAVDAIPDGPEKSHADLLMKVADVQMRECHILSIGVGATVARAFVSTLSIRPSA
jgi:hypothetical protein